MAEIFRAGIQSIDKGQTEAAHSLGMTHFQTMKSVILPQAIKRMIPPFGNEFIVLIKDSSLFAVIAAPELMYWSNAMRSQYFKVWEPYLTAALIYFILTYSLSKLLGLSGKESVADMTAMIEVRNLKKSFGDNVVLRDISADIQNQEVLVVIGPSGSGKSTFLRCLNLLEQPDGGTHLD